MRMPRALDVYPYKERVQPTARFKEQFPKRTHALGRITGFSNDGKCIWVQQDGRKTAFQYHTMYWELVTPRPCAQCGEITTTMHECKAPQRIGTNDACEGYRAINQIFSQTKARGQGATEEK